jgi:hypothetical protein
MVTDAAPPDGVAMCSASDYGVTALVNGGRRLHRTSLPRTASVADASYYDEQLGLTLTQDFGSVSYNVTAVQQDYEFNLGAAMKTGPAYLLNGLSDQGYWYQVGLSWNWRGDVEIPEESYVPGFNAIYAVFGPDGTEVYPVGGSGAVLVSLYVNQGDSVQLSLYFSGDDVVMYVYDWNTSATSRKKYSSNGATYFVGLSNRMNNDRGFFTGLMTEQYHDDPYYGNMQEVVYSDTTYAKSSAWMWIIEFNAANNTQILFFDLTRSPVSFSDPTQFQSFFSHGETEYSNAYQFITGARTIISSPSTPRADEQVLFNASDICCETCGPDASFAWNFGDEKVTTGILQTTTHYYSAEGNYTVTLNVTDNNGAWGLISFYVSVTFKTDLNRDLSVNILDMSIVARAFRSRPGEPSWNPTADLNKDNVANILDISLVARDYGRTF